MKKTTYRVEFSDGSHAQFRSYTAAVHHAIACGALAVGHPGDLSDGGDRTLCWASEAEAANDAGQRSLAAIYEEVES